MHGVKNYVQNAACVEFHTFFVLKVIAICIFGIAILDFLSTKKDLAFIFALGWKIWSAHKLDFSLEFKDSFSYSSDS